MPHPFKGRTAILATKHGKEAVLKPILEKELGLTVIVPENYDTDIYGTFSGEKQRTGNQLEAARKKALGLLGAYDADIYIASEGSFDSDPSLPWVISNLELVILVDVKNNWEIIGHNRTAEHTANGRLVSSSQEAVEFAREIGFPDHRVIEFFLSSLRFFFPSF